MNPHKKIIENKCGFQKPHTIYYFTNGIILSKLNFMRKTINILGEDKAKLILLQEKMNFPSEAKAFSYLISNFENPKEIEKIVEIEKPYEANEMRCFLFPSTIKYVSGNKDLIKKHFQNENLLLNNALIYFLRKLGDRYTLEAETIKTKE